jgi:hypothetical protein
MASEQDSRVSMAGPPRSRVLARAGRFVACGVGREARTMEPLPAHSCASVRCVTASVLVAMKMQPGFSRRHSVAYLRRGVDVIRGQRTASQRVGQACVRGHSFKRQRKHRRLRHLSITRSRGGGGCRRWGAYWIL